MFILAMAYAPSERVASERVALGSFRSARIKSRCLRKCAGDFFDTSSNMRSALSLGPSVIVPKAVACFQLDATSASSSAVNACDAPRTTHQV